MASSLAWAAASPSSHTPSPSSSRLSLSFTLLPRRPTSKVTMLAPLQVAITATSDTLPTLKAKLRPETGLRVRYQDWIHQHNNVSDVECICTVMSLPSGNVNVPNKGNGAGYAQHARALLNGMPDKRYRDSSLPLLKAAAARVESREETNEINLEDVKKALIRAVANTNRGKNASLEQRKSILAMINELENANPTKNPVKSPLLSGYWSLLYTAPIDESKADKYAGTQEGPFLARVKPLAFGSIRQTRSSQVIDVEGGVAKNIADFTFFGKNGTLTIKGNAAPSPINGKETTRLDVVFEEFSVRIGSWTFPNVSLRWINPKGWVDTTFLDEDMRVGRGDKGSVFVSVRVKM